MLNSTSEKEIIYLGYLFIAPMSALLSLLLMLAIIFMQMREYNQVKRNHMSKIYWMSFADFGFSIRNCIQLIFRSPPTGSIYCWLSAVGGVFFVMATQSWYFIISFGIFEAMRFNRTHKSRQNIYHIFVWGLSTFAAILPIHTYGLEPETGTCWIMDHNNTANAYRLVVFIPLSIYMSFAIVVLIIMISNVYSVLHQQSRKTLLMRTSALVGVFVFTWFPTWLWTLLKLIQYPPPSWIGYLTNLLASASGILNFIVWMMLFFPDIRKICKSKNKMKKLRKKKQSVNNVTNRTIDSQMLDNDKRISENKTKSLNSTDFNETYRILESTDMTI